MSRETVESLITQAAESTGYMIHESGVLLRGENSHISVKIDSLEGISHQDCQAFSNELCRLLDEAEVLSNYSLEVSSPGIQRKLRDAEDYKRFTGSRVKVNYINDEGNNRSVTGKLLGFEERVIQIQEGKKTHTIDINSITSSNIELQ